MPRVSIITPTFNRQNLLPALWDCVRAQSFQDIEWLIHDDSPQRASMFDAINDPRVTYTHIAQPMKIGAKRNALCKAAQGEIIAHFDDDDFYGPNYIREMVSFMTEQKADFVKLFGFFLYHRTHKTLAYWDLEIDFPLHWVLSRNEEIIATPNNGHMSGKWGYGFSYVFRRKVWETTQFPPDKDHGEDQPFADAAVRSFNSAGKRDFGFSCLHIIHANNMSKSYPQQLLPPNALPDLFPDFRP
jgi:glycosyltransferase involved in cell wall biosynthesis